VPLYFVVLLAVLSSAAHRGSKVLVALSALELGASAFTVGIIGALFAAFPLLLALSYSFMSEFDIATFPPPVIPAHPSLDNYGKVLATIPIGRYLLNSFIVSTAVVIGQLITASLAAYAFSFLIFRGRQVLFFLFLSTLMIPWEATIIPNYMTIRSLGWLDTYQGLAVPFMATAFGTFLLRQAFMQIPRELWDAARIDGSTTFRFLREIVIPLSRPALGTIAIVTKHELVLAIVGGLFVLEAVSVIVQVISYKLTGRRVFRMAPLHHHFEQKGWSEPTIVIRFWIIAAILAIAGLATLKLR